MKLIFILYSTPSFRINDCFLMTSRSPERERERERERGPREETNRESQQDVGREESDTPTHRDFYLSFSS